MVEGKSIQIICNDENEFMEGEIIAVSDQDTKIGISNFNNLRIDIEFDYLAKHDGAVIQVLHTGDVKGLKFDCKIKGGNKIQLLSSRDKLIKSLVNTSFLSGTFDYVIHIIYLIAIAVTFVLNVTRLIPHTKFDESKITIIVLLLFALELVALSLSLYVEKHLYVPFRSRKNVSVDFVDKD